MTVRLASLDGRAWLLSEDGRGVDLAVASDGRFGPDPMQALARFGELRAWARDAEPETGEAVDPARLGPCVPRPRSVFAIGLNYRDHAAEAGLDVPSRPMVFTKFPTCLCGPRHDVWLFSDRVDWEVELVVVIGRAARDVSAGSALDFVAGYCAGQDVSDRALQFSDRPPQFCLGKSRETFGPIGPAVVSLDAFDDPLDLRLGCRVDDEVVQDGRTRDMIFSVPDLVAYLSRHCPLAPGDLIFTGTPAGVGSVRDPRRYLRQGQWLESRVEGVGTLRNRCVAPPG